MVFRALNADSVQMIKRPRWPPGASWRRFKAVTGAVSTPGILRKALTTPAELSSAGLTMTRGPRRWR